MEKKLIIKIVILLILFGTGISAAIYFGIEGRYIELVIAILIAMYAAIRVIFMHTAYIKKMKYIIAAIENKDYMFSFVANQNKQDINTYLNLIKQMLEGARKEVEDNEIYYQYILDNISSGIIIANQNDSILQANNAMKDILAIDNLSHINNLSLYYKGLSEVFRETKPLLPQTFSFSTEKEQLKISILLTMWERNGKLLKIYTVNNISSELEYKEMESWNRLTRVLTHEIMNSLTPIITISSSLVESKKINDKDVVDGLNIISTTGDSLAKFVNNYRELSKISTPVMQPIYVKSLVENIVGLFDVTHKNIDFKINIKQDDLMIFADEGQIRQVIINLVKNGVESIENKNGEVEIEAYCEANEDIIIKIFDTGRKIDEDIAENMFIPFFTTKEGGSGIGLSISRQIMRLHNGSISLLQQNDRKNFILKFK